MIHPFEPPKSRDVGRVGSPSRVISLSVPVVLLEERNKRVLVGQYRVEYRQHAEDAAQGIFRARKVDFGLEEQLGISV